MSERVIVIGAGAAGLMAARAMISRGIAVTVLESRTEAGGRIRSISAGEGRGVVEGGAEFIHGKLPETLALCNQAGIAYVETGGVTYRRNNGRWMEEDDMVDGWDDLMDKMSRAQPDDTLSAFLETHFPGDAYAALRKQATNYVQGFDLADPRRVSVQATYQEWSHEETENFRLPGGYMQLIHTLEDQCRAQGSEIHTAQTVTTVEWRQGAVVVQTRSGQRFEGTKVLTTVPVGLLASISHAQPIQFHPEIPEYRQAASDIGYGSVVRLMIDFKKRFWKEDTGFVLSDEAVPTWWTQFPINNNLLTGWAGGPRGERLAGMADEEIVAVALQSLANLYDRSFEELRSNVQQSFVFNWNRDIHAQGGYSFPTPASAAARRLLNQPMATTLYFAGEALYEGDHPGTVEAALVSGRQVADRIVRDLGEIPKTE